jgi:ubiquinone/menaquinone biosynthesis C-methylase UbiE
MGVFFQSPTAASRYSKSRIHFHDQAIDVMRQLLTLKAPFPWALDVGCGTGHSTIALRALATNVLGIDLSAAMLSEALPCEQVVYAKSSAEKINIPDASVQLMTASQSFHWFNSRPFYLECSRVLATDGSLFIYGHQLSHPCLDFFDEEFPSPYKQPSLNPVELDVFSLRFLKVTKYEKSVTLDLKQTIDYLLTMSAVEKALEMLSLDEVEKKLMGRLGPAFAHGPLTFQSAGQVWWLKKL